MGNIFTYVHKYSLYSDIKKYHNCKLTKTGNIFEWEKDTVDVTSDTSKLKISELNTTDEVKEKLCLETPAYYVPLGKKLTDKVTFGAGQEFCRNIGGRMAVIGRLTSLHFPL